MLVEKHFRIICTDDLILDLINIMQIVTKTEFIHIHSRRKLWMKKAIE